MKKGYVVIESCEEYEQILCLEKSNDTPKEGILCFPGEGFERHIFADRKQAQSAIKRTHHYAIAFGGTDMPEKKHCKIRRVILGGPEV